MSTSTSLASWIQEEKNDSEMENIQLDEIESDSKVIPPKTVLAIKRARLLLRALYLGTSLLILIAAILSLTSISSITTSMISVYIIIFSSLLCCFGMTLSILSYFPRNKLSSVSISNNQCISQLIPAQTYGI